MAASASKLTRFDGDDQRKGPKKREEKKFFLLYFDEEILRGKPPKNTPTTFPRKEYSEPEPWVQGSAYFYFLLYIAKDQLEH